MQVVDGYVHDITPFLEDHPGGKDIMLDHLGKDVSDVFVDDRVHAHGTVAYNMLAKYPLSFLFLLIIFSSSFFIYYFY